MANGPGPFGPNFRRALKQVGLTPMEAARALDVTHGTIHHWLAGRNMPTAANLQRAARLVRRPVSRLLGERKRA